MNVFIISANHNFFSLSLSLFISMGFLRMIFCAVRQPSTNANRLRQESELLSRSSSQQWSPSDLQSSASANNISDNNSSGSTSSTETLKWLGSMSDVSVSSHATNSSHLSGTGMLYVLMENMVVEQNGDRDRGRSYFLSIRVFAIFSNEGQLVMSWILKLVGMSGRQVFFHSWGLQIQTGPNWNEDLQFFFNFTLEKIKNYSNSTRLFEILDQLERIQFRGCSMIFSLPFFLLYHGQTAQLVQLDARIKYSFKCNCIAFTTTCFWGDKICCQNTGSVNGRATLSPKY